MFDSQENERQRLTELYAGMTLEQLQQIASESTELTDIARAVLEAEIKRRGISISDLIAASARPLADVSSELAEPKLVMVRRFGDVTEALLAKGRLDSAGIESSLADDNMVRIFIPNFLGGVRMLVREEDFAEAIDVLDQPIIENFTADDDQE